MTGETPGQGTEPVRILTVCTHNRTRSVMMAALIESMLTARLGQPLVVTSSGFGPAGLPAIDDAIAAMARRNLDVGQHRSQPTTTELIDHADIILTAERDHVVRIAAMSPAAFRRSLTLPELLARAADPPLGVAAGIRPWVHELTATRTAGAYLRDPIAEVPDPTGSLPRMFEQAVVLIEQQCTEAVELLTRLTALR